MELLQRQSLQNMASNNMKDTQLTNTVVMVKPNHFGFNPQTAGSNIFQHQVPGSENEVQHKALNEFNGAVKTLKEAGINVLILNSREDAVTPDSIFPNNWFSHHSDGRLVIYPMLAPNRREERQAKSLEDLLTENKIPITEVIDLTKDENSGNILEGTGSLVLDRENKIAFAMESPRTVREEFEKWCKIMSYEGVFFHAYDKDGFPIYHTNVTMSIGREYAVICLDSITDQGERQMVESKLKSLGKEIIALTKDQIYKYCGNTLQVLAENGSAKIIMSLTARDGLNPDQLKALEYFGEIIPLEIPVIETVGGGSARCMLAEVFLQD